MPSSLVRHLASCHSFAAMRSSIRLRCPGMIGRNPGEMLNLFCHRPVLVLCAALSCTSCAIATSSRAEHATSRADRTAAVQESVTATALHGKRLELHIALPAPFVRRDLLVVYASGDGGWFGAAIDQWRKIARAGYATVGFSSRTFLRIERPAGAPLNAARLANEYEFIVQEARKALGWQDSPKVILAGWSRGAAFSVLVGNEPAF